MANVDLRILKKLVAELESTLAVADLIAEKGNADKSDHVVELSKASGLCTGLMQEASLLVLDIHAIVRTTQIPSDKGNDLISSLLGAIKGPGSGSQN